MQILIRFLLLVSLALLGCEAKSIIDPPVALESGTLTPKNFTTGSTNTNWVYFSFSQADTVAVLAPATSLNWDIALRRTTIKINGGTSGSGKGGALMLSGVNFEDLKAVPANAVFAADDTLSTGYAIPTGSGEGWYSYTGEPNHWIVPIADRVFIFRCANEKYAKVQITSYYSNGQPPSQPLQTDSGYYTFKFVYQSNGSMSFE